MGGAIACERFSYHFPVNVGYSDSLFAKWGKNVGKNRVDDSQLVAKLCGNDP